MATRDDLIARKAEVQSQIRSLQPKVEAARGALASATGLRRAYYTSRLASMESQLEALAAEEMRLRVEIDRSPR
jgi:hypothetical protein